MFKTILLLLLLSATCAFANLNFTLSPTLIATPPGGISDPTCVSFSGFCVIFSGSITGDAIAPGSNDYSINDIVISFSGNGNTYLSNGDCFNSFYNACNFFFGNLNVPSTGPPGTIAAGDPTFMGTIFEVDVDPVSNGDPVTPSDVYFGTATLLGDIEPSGTSLDTGATNFLAEADFQIDVTPEPATFGLMLLGLAAGVAAYRRRAA